MTWLRKVRWSRAAWVAAAWTIGALATALLIVQWDAPWILYSTKEAIALVIVAASPLAAGLSHRSMRVSVLTFVYLLGIASLLYIIILMVVSGQPTHDEEYFRRRSSGQEVSKGSNTLTIRSRL